jgi:flagellar hook-associated protein 2
MSGITTGIGLISGIDTSSLIEQLLSIEARPKQLAQQRVVNLKLFQTSYLDLSSRMRSLETAAAAFRTAGSVFNSKLATSSLSDTLRATATSATPEGSYSFVVDRLVTTQQALSRGFSDRDTVPFGASSFTFEGEQGKLETDQLLADLNAGTGVRRGTLEITQGGNTASVDLTKAATIREVVDAINDAEDVDVTATIRDGALVLTSGAGEFTVASADGSADIAGDLGIAGSSTGGSLTGSTLTGLSGVTLLRQLNDGNGVYVGTDSGIDRYDFKISVGGTEVNINIGAIFEEVTEDGETTIKQTSPAVNNMAGVLSRINDAMDNAGFGEVNVAIDGQRLRLTDSMSREIVVTEKNANTTTAADLGLLGTGATGSIGGQRLLAGMGTVLLRNLNGGAGISGDRQIDFTSRDGTVFSVDLTSAQTVEDVMDLINNDPGNAGRLKVSLNEAGSGLALTDTTGGGGNLIVAGDSATSLGFATEALGVASDTIGGTSLQRKYVSMGTKLNDLARNGTLGTGTIRLTDGNGASTTVNIGTDSKTVFDLISEVNSLTSSAGVNIELAINDNGDGLVFRERSGQPAGTQAIRIEDVDGGVAAALKLAGTGGTPGEPGAVNQIMASQEVTVTFDENDTLDDAITKINGAGAGVRATIINDGSSVSPFRLSLVSENSGRGGRFTLDTGGFDLGLESLEAGEDARVFFGSTDPSRAVLLTSSDNTLDSVVSGLTLDLVSASANPVTITVSRDTETLEKTIETFITAYNAVMTRIDGLTGYDAETERRGALLGDSTTNGLRSRLSSTALGQALNVSGDFRRLTDVGLKFATGGKLEFDRDRFRAALAEDPEAVKEVFAARDLVAPNLTTDLGNGVTVSNPDAREGFSKLGVIFRVEELVKEYINSVDGVFKRRDTTLKAQIDAQESRVVSFDRQLERRRAQLSQQFLAMEQALLQLQGQQSALTSLGG